MVGWHHPLNGHEFEQTLGGGEGQESLAAVHGVAMSWTRLSDLITGQQSPPQAKGKPDVKPTLRK